MTSTRTPTSGRATVSVGNLLTQKRTVEKMKIGSKNWIHGGLPIDRNFSA